MKKMRMILAFWILVFLSIHYHYFTLFYEGIELQQIIIKQVVLSIITVSALIIFVSTFFRVDLDVNGQLCYDSNNIFWKYISKIWYMGPQVKLCKMYWLTAAIVAFGYLWLACIGGVLYYVFTVTRGFIVLDIGIIILFAFNLLTFLSIIGIFRFFEWLEGKYGEKVSLPFIAFFLIVVVLGLLLIMFEYMIYPLFLFLLEMTTSASAWVMIGSILFFSMISVYLLTRLCFKCFPTLRKTIIGRMYLASENKLCPTIYACEYGVENKRKK